LTSPTSLVTESNPSVLSAQCLPAFTSPSLLLSSHLIGSFVRLLQCLHQVKLRDFFWQPVFSQLQPVHCPLTPKYRTYPTMPPDLNSVPPSPKPQLRPPPRVSTSSSRRTSSTLPPPSGPHSPFISPTLPQANMAAGEMHHTSAGSGTMVTVISLLDHGS
jgi:hypothetical protein